ncbi:MAG: HlyC/CorC family transporter [Nitrospinae bacterium]|nr:HlyC/CorC family transporter [Nitrospinota bacterium]
MDPWLLFHLVLLFILLLMSAFFSAAEVALFSLSRLQVENLREHEGKAGRGVAALLERPRRLLVTIYTGNELVNVSFAAVSTIVALHFFQESGVAVAVGASTLVLLMFGEISPKSFALKYAERYALFAAGPLQLFARIIFPLQAAITWITNRALGSASEKSGEGIAGITEDEIKTMLDHGEDKGVIEALEKEMILNVFELGDITAIDVMTPRTQLFAVDIGLGTAEIARRAINSNFSRIPVYRGAIDHIAGIIYTKDLMNPALAAAERPEDLLREAYFIPGTKKVDELLRAFRKGKIHMAVILDEYGGVEGIVTLEDILERVVGEERAASMNGVKQVDQRHFQIAGRMPMEDFNEHFNAAFEHEDIETIGGFVFHLFGRMPRWGESVTHGRFTFTVQKLKAALISQLLVTVADEPPPAEGGEEEGK